MNISDFEKHIHHTFHQQEVPLNTREFASNLFARMDKKEKKYPFGWIFGLLIIGILGLGGTYFYANSQMATRTTKSTSTTNFYSSIKFHKSNNKIHFLNKFYSSYKSNKSNNKRG
ncbi:MAG: hypothetical protein IPN79_04905 [Saprospiraceae bacterium]|nr:hypothetical protein [Saprospiraceae bacterium]